MPVLQRRPLQQRMHAVVDDALDAHRTEPRADVAGVRRGLHAPADRAANTEGALTGPRRPTNGSLPPAPQTPRDAAALRLVCLARLI